MKKLLLIEDDENVQLIYSSVFEDAGFSVVKTSDGTEGLRLIREGGYDAILLDLLIPHTDGIAILTALKQTPPMPQNGPIILLTNMSDEDKLQRALSLGATSSLLKSNKTPDDVLRFVQRAIATHAQQSTQTHAPDVPTSSS